MIKVTLKDGTTVEVSGGKVGVWTYRSIRETSEVPTDVGAILEIREKDGYGAAVLASFKAEEVVGYAVDTPEDEQDKTEP